MDIGAKGGVLHILFSSVKQGASSAHNRGQTKLSCIDLSADPLYQEVIWQWAGKEGTIQPPSWLMAHCNQWHVLAGRTSCSFSE